MKFIFFTLGGRFRWEDVYNYQNWRIQRNIRTKKYRLLDPYDIKRESGYFELCKDTLLKYIKAYEISQQYDDTILIIHGFSRTKNSVIEIANYLKDLPTNIISFNYSSTNKGLQANANLLENFLQNIENKGNLYIINIGSACLLTRKFISSSNNFRNYKIARVLDINPINSGSDLAELLSKNIYFNKIFGPMPNDISTNKVTSLPRLPQEIDHGIIFCPSTLRILAQKMLSRYDGFPFSTPPSEKSYAKKIKEITHHTFLPLENPELLDNCRQYISSGEFLSEDKEEDE